MTCLEMEEKLAEFLAGELSERSAVEEHLLACADCRATFSLAKSGWEAAVEWKVAGPSGDAIAATLEAIKPLRTHRGLIRVLQAGTIAASLVIAFAIGSSDHAVPEQVTAPVATAPVSTGLASLRPSVGLLFVRDENGKPAGELAIRRLSVKVDIRDGIARTEIEEVFENRTDRRLEGTFQFPLPPDASISRLAMEIEGKLMEGEVVEREKARQTYEGIVRSMKDPALLEWMPGGIFQCRIFPIEPRSDKRIIIAYTQALSVFDGRGRYVFPLAGESMKELGIGRFEFTGMIRSGSKIVKAESTSHAAATIRLDDRTMRTTLAISDFKPGSDFVLAFESEEPDEIQVSAHRSEGADPGYFAAFITPRLDVEEVRRDRRLYFLLDVSGSVARSELEAARMVVRRMIDSLEPADRFRIGCHNLIIGSMPESVAPDENGKRAAERYLADLATEGASDVATAMEMALSLVSDGGEVIYIGEGTPTWGEKDPAKIVARIREAIGTRKIAIRTVAVGSDAEKGLLETISREFNGGAHAISPSDDVGARADEIARTLGRAAISNLKAEFEGSVTDAAPGTLGSIHVGERLFVTGRYGPGAAKLILSGRVRDRVIRREFPLALPEREAGNLHVKRLWAQRRLADLVSKGDAKRADAVKLSVEHQVMTPYTSFLVLENEKAYDDYKIGRTKKDADQTKDPSQKATAKAPPNDREGEAHYRRAIQHYDSGDFEKAEAECQAALSRNPNHGASHALMLEIQFALGRGLGTSQSQEFESIIQMATARQQQVIFEVRDALDQGTRSYNLKDYSDAERHFRTVIEYAKWLPKSDALERHRKQASDMLEKVSVARSTPSQSKPAEPFTERHNVREITGPRAALKPVFDGEALANLIKATIDKASWNEADGRSCVFQNGNLIVRNSPDVQRKVQKFLRDLRSSNGTLVSVESRFLTVEDNFLQQVGGDFLEMHNVQDLAYGLQDFPGVNIVLSEDALGTLGRLVNDDINPAFSTLPGQQFATFIDPDGGGGTLAVSSPGITGTFGWDTGQLRDLEPQISTLAVPVDPRVPFLGDLPRLDDLFAQRNQPPAGGYDVGGTGFTDIHESQELGKLEARLDLLQDWLQASEKANRDTGALEAQYAQLARDRQRLQETIAALNATGVRTDMIMPRKALAGQVMAVAPDLDLVVISIGRDAGVNEGDEFTIYRGNSFVAKFTVDRVDRQWASGRVTLKGKEEPRIGDHASNNVLATPGMTVIPPPPLAAPSADEVILSGMEIQRVRVGCLIVITRKERYVATAQALEGRDGKVRARVLPRLRIDTVVEGDKAVPVESDAQLWKLLPESIRQDLLSERDLAVARMRLLMIRAARGGGK